MRGLISYVVPCKERTVNLRQVLPSVLEAARNSPPVEIVIVDYNSQDGLDEYLDGLNDTEIVSVRYEDRNYFHMAHARNIGCLYAAKGEWLLPGSTEFLFSPGLFAHLRDHMTGADFFQVGDWQTWPGVTLMRRGDFVAAGGYDERFEFYGGEDKDLRFRLERRGLTVGQIAFTTTAYMQQIDTDLPKNANYRLPLTRSQMARISNRILADNISAGVLVANEGLSWGR